MPLTELNGAPTQRGDASTKRETAVVVEELFRACKQKSPSLALIRALVQERPAAACAKRYRNYFPVTAAIASGASAPVVRYLVQQYPQAIQVAVNDKIQLSSESCERTTKSRNLVLHQAFWSNKGIMPLDVLKYLLQLEPRLASVPDYTGWIPLHVACKTYCSYSVEGDREANHERVQIIRALVEAFPDSVLARTNDGRLPLDVLLHDACRRNSTRNNPVSPPPPQFVLESVTLAATGYPPVHFACRYNAPIKTIKYLLKLDPNAVSTPTLGLSRDNDIGLLPLHCACLAIANSTEEAMTTTSKTLSWTATTTSALRVLQLLLKHNSRAASVKTVTKGETPLHCACHVSGGGEKDLSLLDIIQFLVAQNPAAVDSHDNKGRLPGQVLCLHSHSRHASCDSLYFLLRQYPHAILAMK